MSVYVRVLEVFLLHHHLLMPRNRFRISGMTADRRCNDVNTAIDGLGAWLGGGKRPQSCNVPNNGLPLGSEVCNYGLRYAVN